MVIIPASMSLRAAERVSPDTDRDTKRSSLSGSPSSGNVSTVVSNGEFSWVCELCLKDLGLRLTMFILKQRGAIVKPRLVRNTAMR